MAYTLMALVVKPQLSCMKKVLKKKNPGAGSRPPKIIRLYPGKSPAPVAPASAFVPAKVFPLVQMPPQPEAYLKADEFDSF